MMKFAFILSKIWVQSEILNSVIVKICVSYVRNTKFNCQNHPTVISGLGLLKKSLNLNITEYWSGEIDILRWNENESLQYR